MGTSIANSNAIPFISRDNIRDKIMKSLVCWYDLGKQGATNESMKAHPYLIDLSGNGHDMTCRNFAWSGMSGIGGYNWAYNTFSRNTYFEHTDNTVILEHSNNTVFENVINLRNTTFEDSVIKGQKFNIDGIADGVRFEAYISIVGTQSSIVLKDTVTEITQNGEYSVQDLDISELEDVGYIYYGFRKISIPEGVTVTIENIPLYPNALVSDGVDDCSIVENMPILSDYTVIVDRTWLDTSDADKFRAVAALRTTDQDSVFIFEGINSINRKHVFNYGQATYLDSFSESSISYQTSESYNGKVIGRGTTGGATKLNLSCISVGWGYSKVAIRSLIVFDRTLTTEEIEWVKKNMIGL